MAENDQEKSEAPTPRRLEEAREEGNVARSTDLTAACILLAAVLLLDLLGGRLFISLQTMIRELLSSDWTANPTRSGDLHIIPGRLALLFVTSLFPLLITLALVAFAAAAGQVGFLFTTKPLELDLTKLSPLKGFKNIFGLRGVMRFVMNVAKVLIIGGVAYLVIHLEFNRILSLPEKDVTPMFYLACRLVFHLGLKLGILLLILALLDYMYQRWQRQRDLRMSKQDVREELKRMEGDPMIKQRRMRVARQLAMQRTAQAVPRADVIVTNPTHFAVALKYDPSSMKAPKVVAKGVDFLAQRMRQIAAQHGVPVIERKELARALHKHVEVGQEIPPKYFSAVAEIIAYVYRLAGRRSA